MDPRNSRDSREAAEEFGKASEDALEATRRGWDALNGKSSSSTPPKDEEDDGDITININR